MINKGIVFRLYKEYLKINRIGILVGKLESDLKRFFIKKTSWGY